MRNAPEIARLAAECDRYYHLVARCPRAGRDPVMRAKFARTLREKQKALKRALKRDDRKRLSHA